MQSLRGAFGKVSAVAPRIEKLYVTEDGLRKVEREFPSHISELDIFLVSEGIMKEMTDTSSPQGLLALCSYKESVLEEIGSANKIAYFWQLQDPGNAGTVIRTADACGFDAVIFSDQSVDIYSPKVVRSTAGSLWNIPVVEAVALESFLEFATSRTLMAFDGNGSRSLTDVSPSDEFSLIFGNEARGLPQLPDDVEIVSIPMKGYAESFNVASAAAIAMFHVSR